MGKLLEDTNHDNFRAFSQRVMKEYDKDESQTLDFEEFSVFFTEIIERGYQVCHRFMLFPEMAAFEYA